MASVHPLPWHRRFSLALWRFRRLLTVMTVVCGALAVKAIIFPPVSTVTFTQAASDIAPGTVITQEHLTSVTLETTSTPPQEFADASALLGSTARMSIRGGDVMTMSAVTDTPAVPHGYAATTVRIANPTFLPHVEVGDTLALLPAEADVREPVTSSAILLSLDTSATTSHNTPASTDSATSEQVTALIAVPHDEVTEVTAVAQWAAMAIVLVAEDDTGD
ncbi:SAF domain-containing protein [Jonesia quinghaiensis]|uniref:SAF domain-containing protein n=1 Tax=Jonesia quinghaiensis TaxID=262806 RepID=UPI000490AF12|nr:SAF domain-containing protein [Jonesia quinghaiensis]